MRGFARSSNQPSSWSLEVELVREQPAGLEAALGEVLQALDDALGLRIAAVAEVPADPQLPAEGSKRVRRTTAAGVQPGLAVPDQRLGSAPSATGSDGSRTTGPAISLAKISAPAPARE